MAGAVPPQIESPKTFIGVEVRELMILGLAGVLGVTTLFLPMHLIPKVGLAALVVGLGLAAAFGRDRRSGKTIEAYLLDRLRFHSRRRFRQKGADDAIVPAPALQSAFAMQQSAEQALDEGLLAEHASTSRIRVRPLPLGKGLFFSILSFAFLLSLLAWIWLGGLVELESWLFGRGF